MENNWKDWFYFSKSERRGIVVLVSLIILVAFFPYIYEKFIYSDDQQINYQQELAKLQANQPVYPNVETETVPPSPTSNEIENESTPSPLSSIEDNSTSIERNQLQQVEQIEEIRKPRPTVNVNVNTATAEQLAQLPGIGPVLSNRIVKFRTALGGFISVEQVGTTYGIEPDVFATIKNQLQYTPISIQKKNINTASAEQLQSHPYISPQLAKQMVNYREKVKEFETKEDVMSLYFMDEELYEKLEPYITY